MPHHRMLAGDQLYLVTWGRISASRFRCGSCVLVDVSEIGVVKWEET